MAPRVGLEPTTDRLTADCSTTELPWNKIVFCSHLHAPVGFRTGRAAQGRVNTLHVLLTRHQVGLLNLLLNEAVQSSINNTIFACIVAHASHPSAERFGSAVALPGALALLILHNFGRFKVVNVKHAFAPHFLHIHISTYRVYVNLFW